MKLSTDRIRPIRSTSTPAASSIAAPSTGADQAHVTPPAESIHGAVVAVVEIVDVLTPPKAAAFAPWFFGPVRLRPRQHQDASDAGAGEGTTRSGSRVGRPAPPGRTRLARHRPASSTTSEPHLLN